MLTLQIVPEVLHRAKDVDVIAGAEQVVPGPHGGAVLNIVELGLGGKRALGGNMHAWVGKM